MDRTYSRFLIIGSGGRENAIVKALFRTRPNESKKLFVACIGTWENPGIYQYIGEENYYKVDNLHNVDLMVQIAVHLKIELVIIGSEEQLALGVVDEMNRKNIKCFGPTKKMAQIETSKTFMRELLHEELLQYAPFWISFKKNDEIWDEKIVRLELKNILEENFDDKIGYVIKADGLKGGKGVKLYGEHLHTHQEAIDYCIELLNTDGMVLIEEKLQGQEFSLMTLFDTQRNAVHLPIVQDYKRLNNNNQGPNTGGMGSYLNNRTESSLLTNNDIKMAQQINQRVFDILTDTANNPVNTEYVGVLYGSFIKTVDGIMIIEYNSRFGDPEVINLMHLLESDLSYILTSMHNGSLLVKPIKFRDEYCVSCYACPVNYPGQTLSEENIIQIDDSMLSHDCLIYASIVNEDSDFIMDNYRMLGSRAFAIVVSGDNLKQILDMIDSYFSLIKGNYYRRTDIGHEYILTENNDMMTYKDAGVNIDEGDKVVECIKESVKSTFNDNVIKGQYGNFGGSYKMDDEWTLVTSMDGVGTKVQMVLNLLPREEAFESLGYDLFSSNINDILCLGRKVEPMFFLDYFGCQKLNHQDVYHVVKGLSRACRESNCVLIGGETAELKNFSRNWENYRRTNAGVPLLALELPQVQEILNVPSDNYELVGTIVGKMKESLRFDAGSIRVGDIVVALRSNGLHTNGYSLVNKLITEGKLDGVKWRDVLCATHKNYYKDLEKIWQTDIVVKGVCHITGGGIDNVTRIMSNHLEVEWIKYDIPEIFLEIQRVSKISKEEMFRTFNCGIGIILLIELKDVQRLKDIFGDELINVGTIIDKEL